MDQSTPHEISRAEAGSRWLLGSILLLAAFLRLYRLDLISISNVVGIQGLNALSTLRLLNGRDWALAGPLTEDVRSSAFLISLSALVGMFCWNPIALLTPVIVLNLLSVWLLFRLCLRHFGFFPAMTATLLYASSPWAVLYSRLLVPASCLALFCILLVDFSLRWLDEHRKHQLGLLVLLGLVVPQIHFSGLCALPWVTAVLFAGRRHLTVTPLVAGASIGLAAWLPWLKFQQITGWVELSAWARQILDSPAAHAEAFLQALTTLLQMLCCSGFEFWFGNDLSTWPEDFPGWLIVSTSAGSLLLTALFVGAVIQAAAGSSSDFRSSRLVALWIGLALILSTLLRNTGSPDGMLVTQPFGLILVALAADNLRRAATSRWRPAMVAVVVILIAGNISFLAACLKLMNSGQQSPGAACEFSLAQRQTVLNSIMQDAGPNVIQITGPYSGWYPAYEYLQHFVAGGVGSGFEWRSTGLCYWIDEESIPEGANEVFWNRQKERSINPAISEYLGSSPDWVIERHWAIEQTQIYRLRFEKRQPLH